MCKITIFALSMEQIIFDDIVIPIIRKDIKSVNIRLYPQSGEIRITASRRVSLKRIEAFVESKREWITKRYREMIQNRTPVKEYISGESIHFLGQAYKLNVVEVKGRVHVDICGDILNLYIGAGSSVESRKYAIYNWYADELETRLRSLIPKWEKILGVKSHGVRIKNVKSKWGSCNIRTGVIMFNLHLMSKPIECVEYIVVHELTHLIEIGHNARFYSIIERVLPSWRAIDKLLKQ